MLVSAAEGVFHLCIGLTPPPTHTPTHTQRQMSVTQATTIDRQPVPAGITRPENYANGKPVYGGVNDPRMGSLNRRDPCKTCGCTYNEVGQRNRVNECPGHFGHIEVRFPFLWLWWCIIWGGDDGAPVCCLFVNSTDRF